MGDVFLKLLNMSITAGWLILAVVCVRLVFRKMSKWVNCLLWAVVAIRLIVPFSIESKFSLQPSAEPIKSSTIVEGEVVPYVPSVDSTMNIVANTVNPMLAEAFAYQESESVAPLQDFTGIAGNVWLCGMIALLLFAGASMARLHHSVRESVRYNENVYICDHIKSPFILGMIKPRIYLSSSLNENEMDYIIAHEKAHLRRKDHLWKPLGYLLLCIYWFHPLCWIAYLMLCKDIELACDEKVIKYMSLGDKKEYSRVLLSCATQRRLVFACPLAFGEVGVKERVRSVLNYKRPAFWITLTAIMAGAVVAVCFLTNPKQEQMPESETKGPQDTNGTEKEESNVPDTDYQNTEDEVYRKLILEMTETNVFPVTEGIQCSGFPYEYTYSIMDIDDDGKDELLINHSNAGSMAEMALYIYDYDRKTGKVYIEYAGWPGISVYDNGYMKEDASHNHGRSNLDDFWPYHLLKYNNQTDKYECIAYIDAWQYQIAEDIEPDPEFPKDKDLDGDGIVYYDASTDDYKPAMIMDNAEYEAWCEQYNGGTQKVIVWYSIISK